MKKGRLNLLRKEDLKIMCRLDTIISETKADTDGTQTDFCFVFCLFLYYRKALNKQTKTTTKVRLQHRSMKMQTEEHA